MRLQALEEDCEICYNVHAQVGGKIAQVGQRLIDGVAKSMAEDFFKRFQAVLHASLSSTQDPAQAIALNLEPIKAQSRFALKIPVWGWIVVAHIVAAAVAWKLL